MNKKLIYEILFIIIVPVILGGTYHTLIRDPSKRLAWIREKPVVENGNDDQIFGGNNPPIESGDTVIVIDTIIDTPPPKPPREKDDSIRVGGVTNPPTPKPELGNNKPLAVTYNQVLRLNADESVLFFDARNEHEFAEGTIPRAKNIFAMDFEKHIPYILGLPDKNVRIVVFCGGGDCDLSHDLSNRLIQFGFKKVFIYLGGYTEWKAKQGK